MAELPGDLDAVLAKLRAGGADDADPLRFAYLQSLARRAEGQPQAIRDVLMARLAGEAEALAKRQREAAAAREGARETPAPSPLRGLLDYLSELAGAERTARASAPSPGPGRTPASRRAKIGGAATPELKSVTYFRKTWSRLSTEQQLTQTLAQAPENAGPMNSQHLVLRSLQLMRDIAPAYLQGFMSHIDALIWLEEASPIKAGASRNATSAPAAKGKEKTRGSRR